MIIAIYSRIKIDRILHYTFLSALAGTGMALACGISVLIFSSWQTEKEMVACLPLAVSMESKKTASSYSVIGSGSLALRRSEFCAFASQLREELMVVGRNTRPDFEERQELLIQLKTAGEQKKIEAGDLLYLEEVEGALRFSEEPTSFWVRPKFVATGDLVLEAEKESESAQVLIRASQDLGKKVGERFWDKISPPFVTRLKEAKCWGVDLLLQQYGGKEHRLLQGKQKLIMGDEVHFVAPQDRLIWTEGCWKMLPVGAGSQGAPLASIKAVSSKGMEIDVWDETGFQLFSVKLDVASGSKIGLGPDCMPTAVRMRTASQVACTLGKRRLILKEGDWLLRMGSTWRKLKTSEEIDLCLQHKMRGELLIFDKIEKEQGKTILHAHLFDEMRTQMQTLAIPILAEKKKPGGR